MVGGLGGSKGRSRGPPGQIPKSNSLGDFNEAEEEGWNIGQMSDRDIMEEMQQQMMPIIANMSSHRFRDNHDIQYQFTYDNYLRDKMNDKNDEKYKYVNLFHEDGRKDAHINLNNENGMDGPKRQIDRVFRNLANPDGHSFLFMCVQDKINHE